MVLAGACWKRFPSLHVNLGSAYRTTIAATLRTGLTDFAHILNYSKSGFGVLPYDEHFTCQWMVSNGIAARGVINR